MSELVTKEFTPRSQLKPQLMNSLFLGLMLGNDNKGVNKDRFVEDFGNNANG